MSKIRTFYLRTKRFMSNVFSPLEPVAPHEDVLRGKTVQWMGGPMFGLTTTVERMVRQNDRPMVILDSGEMMPTEQFYKMFQILDQWAPGSPSR